MRIPAPFYYLGHIIQLTPEGFVVYGRQDTAHPSNIGVFTDIWSAKRHIDEVVQE